LPQGLLLPVRPVRQLTARSHEKQTHPEERGVTEKRRRESTGLVLRTFSTLRAKTYEEVTVKASAPNAATGVPTGSTIMLWPTPPGADCPAVTTYTVFSIARARTRVRQ